MDYYIDENGFIVFDDDEVNEVDEVYYEETSSNNTFDPDEMLDDEGHINGWSLISLLSD